MMYNQLAKKYELYTDILVTFSGYLMSAHLSCPWGVRGYCFI